MKSKDIKSWKKNVSRKSFRKLGFRKFEVEVFRAKNQAKKTWNVKTDINGSENLVLWKFEFRKSRLRKIVHPKIRCFETFRSEIQGFERWQNFSKFWKIFRPSCWASKMMPTDEFWVCGLFLEPRNRRKKLLFFVWPKHFSKLRKFPIISELSLSSANSRFTRNN